MPGIPQVTKTGPKTFTPGEPITGGQFVEARADSVIGVAAAGSVKVLGVAVTDAVPPGSVATEPVVVNGRPVLDAAPLPSSVAVAYSGVEVPVRYAAAAQFGDRLVVASQGRATPAGEDADPRAVVAVCTAPAGVAADAVGLARLL